MCLALSDKYNCGWCQSLDRCEVKDQCEHGGSAVWLNPKKTCPNPEIISFSPQLGPWEGGTNITIQGINLGKTFQDIYTGVSIAGINCQPYEHLYIKTKQIVCKVILLCQFSICFMSSYSNIYSMYLMESFTSCKLMNQYIHIYIYHLCLTLF